MDDDWQTAASLLRLASGLVDGIQAGVASCGFPDVRPAHGFAFARISEGDATVTDLAVHLGVSKQAASQLVDQLAQRGYVRRAPDPRDARARLVVLTDRGVACTAAAHDAAAHVVAMWRDSLSTSDATVFSDVLRVLADGGSLRPAW